MATEKIINTRIQLKYDTLENWNNNSSLILRKGEVGICAVPRGDNLEQTTPPAIMFKVGDGVVDAQGNVTGTQFKDLPWASALAADVYAWAKKSVPDVQDFGDIIAAARNGLISAESVVKTLNGLKGNVTIEPKTNEARIKVDKVNSETEKKITLAFEFTDTDKTVLNSGITKAKVDTYDGYAAKITEAKNAGTDAADALSAYKTLNDTAVGNKVDKTTTINGHPLSSNVTISKSDISLDKVENKTLDTTVTANSGNYITSGAVKTAIDSAISGVTQFDVVKYDSFAKLPTTGKKGVIYIIAHEHSDSNDSYDEYIWNTALETPAYEKIGNTDVNLSNYVTKSDFTTLSNNVVTLNGIQTITGNKTFTGTNKFQGGTTEFLTSSAGLNDRKTSADASGIHCTTAGNAGTYYMDGKITNGTKTLTLPSKDGTLITTADTMTGASSSKAGSTGLVPTPAAGDQGKFLRGDGTWVAHDNVNTAFGAGKLIRYYGVCNSVSSEQAKTVSITDFGAEDLTAGKLVMIKFSDGNLASAPTLNINNLGAKNITYRGGNSLELAGGTYALIYNGTSFELVGELNTDSKVTSAANHYTPKVDSESQLSVDAAGGSSATWNTTQLVTGVNIQRDAKGHVTGLTVDSIKMPANPNTDTNTAHTHTKGVGLVVTGSGGTSGSVEYKAALASETLDTNAAVSRPTANADRTYPVIADKNGKLATIVPWKDTTYTAATTSDAGLMSAADKTKLDGIATGATKVTDTTVSGWGYIKSYTDTNQKISAGTTTFGANDTIEIKAGTNITVNASSDTKTITINGKSNDDINNLITAKINALDTTVSQPFMKSRTITKLTQKDGIIDALVEDISITASQVSDFTTEVEKKINTHTGVDKTGTVTSVSAGTGLKVTGTASVTPKVEIDDSVVFVLNCGSATVNV